MGKIGRLSALSSVALLWLAFSPTWLIAQSTDATLTGQVADQTKAVIPGAKVTAINNDTNIRTEGVTNQTGAYVLRSLPPGEYRIEVENIGFKTIIKPDVILHVQDTVELNFEMALGSASETVTVQGGAPLVNTQSGSVGTVVDRLFVANMPLNGRSFQSLLLLTPGVVATKANFGEQGQFSVNGQRTNANYYTVDGVSANVSINAGGGTGQSGAGLLPATAVTGGFNNLVSVDALQEFRVQTSTYAPEFGRTPGGQVALVTRSGTNDFHGSLFDYLRNDVLDANNWFANHNGLSRPKERQNDFGGVVGGPMLIPGLYDGRNRTFFFFSYEGLRLRLPLVAKTVPSLSLRHTVPSAVQTLFNAFPIPNGPDVGNGLAQFSASYSDPTTLDAESLRLDHVISNKLTLFARYNYAPSETSQRNSVGALSNPLVTRFNTKTLTHSATWVPRPNISNEFRANWSRQFGGSLVVLDTFGNAVPLTDAVLPPFASHQNTFLQIAIGTAGYVYGRNGEGTQGQINIVDNVAVMRGSHQLKVGVDHRYLFPSAYSRAYDLTYRFANAADAQIGRATVSRVGRAPRADYAFSNFSAYAQDTWRASARVTLTYGLRWELDPPPYGRNGFVIYAASQTDTPSTLAFAPTGTRLWETTHNNFAPRVGLAVKPFNSDVTVVRGGFGVFYDLPAGAISNAVILPPNTVVAPAFVTTYPADSALIPIPALITTGPFSSVMVTDRHLKLPYTVQWNAALEQAISPNQAVTIAYVGAAGRRLLRLDMYFNVNPTFGTLRIYRNSATSDYHAAQFQYRRHLSQGLQALASYTWSHSIDDASNDSSSLPSGDRINLSQEHGPSDFDIRHSLSAAVSYDFPTPNVSAIAKHVLRQWSIDAIVTARSAPPVDVIVSRDLGFGTFAFRPDVVPGVPLYLSDASVPGGKRFNNTILGSRQVGPFVVSTDLRQGTLSRNALRGFAANQINFSLRRQINVTERINAQFRAEFFNIFNHPNFADPSGVLGFVSGATFTPLVGTFGQSASMLNQSLGAGGQGGGFSPLYQLGGPRSIQLSLRLAF